MKFIHMADMHFDTPFTSLNIKNHQGDKRRLEQREIFRNIIEYIKQNEIEFFFIAGDLYEHEYINISTIEFINNQFKQIPNTKIYITPGNHDPYLSNSMYKNFEWNFNVYIFDGRMRVVENENVDIYGYGFDDFYMKCNKIHEITMKDTKKINILITHADLNGSLKNDFEYNPIKKSLLKTYEFDYIALGHIHKPDYDNEVNQNIIYPGSTISFGFDELGEHGVILGEIDNNKILKIEFIKFDLKEFIELNLEINDINSKEELIENINNIKLSINNYYKINLIGYRNFEIDENYIIKFINNNNILKIKNKTKINIDIEKLSLENNLKGLFLKELINDKNNNKITEEQFEKIMELGLYYL